MHRQLQEEHQGARHRSHRGGAAAAADAAIAANAAAAANAVTATAAAANAATATAAVAEHSAPPSTADSRLIAQTHPIQLNHWAKISVPVGFGEKHEGEEDTEDKVSEGGSESASERTIGTILKSTHPPPLHSPTTPPPTTHPATHHPPQAPRRVD